MAKRDEIIDGSLAPSARGGLVYTEIIGWIDLGPARGDDIKKVLEQTDKGERESKTDTYLVRYEQGMSFSRWWIRVPVASVYIIWRIKKGRSSHDKRRIALAMTNMVSPSFEGLQASFPFNVVTKSGFSGEDLISNLIGFYRTINGSIPWGLLKPVSKASALRRWDKHGDIGNFKNYDCRPWLFPDPETNPTGQPYRGELPTYLREIEPWTDFHSVLLLMSRCNEKQKNHRH